jgi:hypothetical protein
MSPSSSVFNKDRLVTLGLCAIFLFLAIGRSKTSLPWVDEGYFYDSFYNWIQHGHTGASVVESKGLPWEGIEHHQYWQPPLLLIWATAWLKMFGLSLTAFRSLAIFAGLWFLASWIYLLNYFGVPAGLRNLVLLFIATDYAVIRAGSDGRPDMLSAAFGLGAFALYLRFRDRNFTLAVFLSQLLGVCAGLTHPIGGVIGLGFILFFFIKDGDWRKLKLIHLPLAILPYALGAAGWGAYIMQDPQSFHKIFFGSAAAGRLSGLSHPLIAMQHEVVVRYLTPYGLLGHSLAFKLKLLIPAVYAAGALLAWLIAPIRRQRFLRPFLVMWAIACFAVFAIDNQRNGTYLVDLFPHYGVLSAAVLWWLYQKKGWRQALVVAVAACFVALQVGGTLYIILTNPYKHQYQPVVDYVLLHAKPGDRIVGSSELGFGIGFDRLHDDLPLGYYVDKKPDLIIWNSRYQAWCDAAQGTAAGDFVQNRLKKFKKIFETGEFQVYTPPSTD